MLAVTICLALLVVGFVAIPPTHCDDGASIERALSGGYDGFTDPYLPLISQTANWALLFLYAVLPGGSWFDWLIVLYSFWGSALLLTPLLRDLHDPWLRLPLGACVLPVVLWSFCSPTFTTATLLLQVGAYVTLLDWARDDRRRGRLLMFSVALSAALLLRSRLALVLLVLLPLYRLSWRQLRSAAPYLLAPLAVIALNGLIYFGTVPKRAREHLAYNVARAELLDGPAKQDYGEITARALHQAGWTQTDFSAFGQWLLYDETKFNRPAIERFLASNRDPQAGLASGLRRVWQVLGDDLVLFAPFICTLLALLIAQWPPQQVRSRGALSAVAWSALIGGVLAYSLAYRFRLRIAFPLLVAWVTGAAVLLQRGAHWGAGRGARGKAISYCVLAAIALSTLPQTLSLWRSASNLAPKRESYTRALEALAARHPTAWLLPMDSSISERLHLPALRPCNGAVRARVIPNRGYTHSERFRRILASLGISGGKALLRWSIDNRRIVYVTNKGERRQQFWERYLTALFGTREQRIVLVPREALPHRFGTLSSYLAMRVSRSPRSRPNSTPQR